MVTNSMHPIWLVLFAALFAALPMVLGLFTAYVKISVVLGLLRSALGTQQVPSGLVIMALSLTLTLYTMSPVFEESARAVDTKKIEALIAAPTLAGFSAFTPAWEPFRKFLIAHSGTRELRVLTDLSVSRSGGTSASRAEELSERPSLSPVSLEPVPPESIPLKALLPAFVLTELKEAFAMGFVLLLPFLVIDLIVANVLVGMGMMMVSPVMVSLPLKLVLFVVADGWLLLAKGLLQSYS
jgi:type III secretory pathway component EscR